MLPRLLAVPVVLAACAAGPAPSSGVKIEFVPGQPRVVRLLVGPEDSFRLSRAGVMDPASPSGTTDRIRYRAAIEGYTANVVRVNALCPSGYEIRDIQGGDKATVISVECSAP